MERKEYLYMFNKILDTNNLKVTVDHTLNQTPNHP